MHSPTGRREALEVLTRRGLSQRTVCRYLGLSRRVSTYALKPPGKDRSLGERLVAASQELPRFGSRRIAAWLSLGAPCIRRLWHKLKLNIPRRRLRLRQRWMPPSGQKRTLKKPCRATAYAPNHSTLGPAHHFAPKPFHAVRGPGQGSPIQPTVPVSIPATPEHAPSRNGDGCMPPTIARAQDTDPGVPPAIGP